MYICTLHSALSQYTVHLLSQQPGGVPAQPCSVQTFLLHGSPESHLHFHSAGTLPVPVPVPVPIQCLQPSTDYTTVQITKAYRGAIQTLMEVCPLAEHIDLRDHYLAFIELENFGVEADPPDARLETSSMSPWSSSVKVSSRLYRCHPWEILLFIINCGGHLGKVGQSWTKLNNFERENGYLLTYWG